jgi:hypothetical protein
MRASFSPATALLMAALGACDSGSPEAPAPKPIEISNPHHEGLMRLSQPMRHLALMRAIRDSGKRCRRVEAGAYQEQYRNMAMWVARCQDQRQWAIYLAPNGDVQARDCAQQQQLGLPACRAPEVESGQGKAG